MLASPFPRPIYRFLFAALLSASWLAGAWAGQISLQEQHPKSKRAAVLEDNEKVAYLYLIPAGKQAPDRATVAYSRVPPVPVVDWKKSNETGEPPLIARDVASARAVIVFPKKREFSFRWSHDGHAVALLRNGEPIALASAAEPVGYSKAVAKPGKLAKPWDQKRYAELIEAR
jgi:hypothetical protein